VPLIPDLYASAVGYTFDGEGGRDETKGGVTGRRGELVSHHSIPRDCESTFSLIFTSVFAVISRKEQCLCVNVCI